MGSIFRRKNVEDKVDDTIYLRNGATLLEKLITSCKGKRNPIRSFSAEELKLSTDNYDAQHLLADSGNCILYKGLLQKRPISVMKFEGGVTKHNYCFNNVVFASQINHKNVLKLIGCCLETQIPTVVFESVQYGTLYDRIYGPHIPYFEPLLWKHRLKIAMEVANAVTYLHIGLPRPIVFADLKPSKILFDEHHVAKLFDFSFSESIPEGETHVKTALRGTSGYLAPEFFKTNEFNETYDAYSFGGLLLLLLTGQRMIDINRYEIGEDPLSYNYMKKYNENNRINEIVDPIIVQDGLCLEREQQLHAFTELALKCRSSSAEERPEMIDVAKQLRKLYLSA